jgi:hypothetical protein
LSFPPRYSISRETFDKMTSFSKGIFSTIFSAGYHISSVFRIMVTDYDDESEV